MQQYDYIRTAHRVYGKTIKEISKETGHSKNTVKKVLRSEMSNYKSRDNQPYPVLGDYIKIIDQWIEQDKESPKKQRHTATRIFNRLKQEEGYTGSYSAVRRYAKNAKIRIGITTFKVFIPSEPTIAGEAEVDWGTAQAIIDGEVTKIKFFCMRSKYSGKHFIRCYPCERQQVFLDAHIQAFLFFGGVFPVLIYDNLTTAVYKVLKGKKRNLQETYAKFCAYYNFTPRFCNTAQAHEKGGVEGLVGYARRNYLVPIPEADSIEELNENLLKACINYGSHTLDGRDKTVIEYFQQEKNHLLSLPNTAFSNIELLDTKVDKYSTARIENNRYSVPMQYCGLRVNALLYVDRIEIFRERKRIVSHKRLYGSNKWILEPDHYLELIQQRPASFESARPIQQWRKQWPQSLERLLKRFCKKQDYSHGVKDFISVLMLYRDYSADDIKVAVELSLELGINSSDGVKHILMYLNNDTKIPEPVENWDCLVPPDISVYGELGGVV